MPISLNDARPRDAAQLAEIAERRKARFAALAIAILFTYYLVYILGRISVGHYGDFSTFYRAALAMRTGATPFYPYEENLAYVYPPLLAVFYIPLTFVSKYHAAQLILLINVTLAILSITLGVRTMMSRLEIPFRQSTWLIICFLAAALGENEFRNQLQSLETDVLMLFCFTLAFIWLDRHPILAGLVLGFALNIKYLSIVALPYLILRRRWKSAAALLAGAVLFALLPALVIGWSRDLLYLQIALGGLMKWIGKAPPGLPIAHVHGITDGLSISITGACARVIGGWGYPMSTALAVAAAIGILWVAIGIVCYLINGLPILLWPRARCQSTAPFRALIALEWPCLIGLMLAFSPDTNPRHLVMAALLNMLAAVLLLSPRPGVPRWPLLIGALAMCFAFIMPLAQFFSRPFCHDYFHRSVQSWGLLLMLATLFWTATRYIRAAESNRPPAEGSP